MQSQEVSEAVAREMEMLTRRRMLQRMGGAAVAIGAGGALLNPLTRAAEARGISASAAGGSVGGTISFLGTSGEDGTAVAKPFLKKYHVTLKVSSFLDLDTELTKLATGGTSEFSVLTISSYTAGRAAELGFVAELDLDRLPGFKDVFPALQKAPWITSHGKTYGFPLSWGTEPCVYNPKQWKQMPPKYTDFADKRFKGALNTLDEPYGNQWLLARSLRLGQNGQYNRLTQKELNQVRDAWIAIKPNIASWAQSYGDQNDLLVRGQSSIALNSWQALIPMAKAKGVTLTWGNPKDDGTYFWSDSYFITSHAPNVDTAYAYLAYMTLPQNNAKMATTLESGATMKTAVKYLSRKSVADTYPYSTLEGGLNSTYRESILPPANNEGRIVGQAAWVQSWEEVKAA